MNLIALYLFLYIPDGGKLMDIVAMVLFGISIGILICYLGGLMAIDLAPKEATGFFIYPYVLDTVCNGFITPVNMYIL